MTTAPETPTPQSPAPQSPAAERVWPAALLVGVAATVVAWIRMPTAVAGWLYAEDGRSFVGDWFAGNGDVSLLWMPYAGYQHLLPRLSSALVIAVAPPTTWALAVNAIACLLVGAVAGLVFVFSRDVISFVPARVVLGLLAVLTPAAGLEALGNLANLHWFLLYLTPWLLLATPRSPAGAWAMALVAFLAVATEPQCAIFLPLAVWRLVQCPACRPVLIGWLVGVVAQVITVLEAPRQLGSAIPPIASTVEGYVLNVGMTLGTTNPQFLGAVLVRLGWWVGFVGVIAILGLAALGFVKGRPMVRIAIGALIYGSVVSWSASFVLGRNPDLFYSEMDILQLGSPPLVRWATAASMFLAATIPITVAVMVQRYPRWRAAWSVVLGGLVLVLVANVILQHPGRDLRTWQDEVRDAEISCAVTPTAEAELVTPPGPDWVVGVPCSEISG